MMRTVITPTELRYLIEEEINRCIIELKDLHYICQPNDDRRATNYLYYAQKPLRRSVEHMKRVKRGIEKLQKGGGV